MSPSGSFSSLVIVVLVIVVLLAKAAFTAQSPVGQSISVMIVAGFYISNASHDIYDVTNLL